MPLPGLGFPAGLTRTVTVVSGDATFSLAEALKYPSSAVTYVLLVPGYASRGSSDVALPAIDAKTDMPSGSSGTWLINGDATGKGGDGSDGNTGPYRLDGAGGGGAGKIVGAGGTATAPATDGSDGTATTGGAAGAAGVGSGPEVFNAPEDGGDAIWLNHAVTARVYGNVFGGGGGGRSGLALFDGFLVTLYDPGQGGDLEEDGWFNGAQTGGVAGRAVRLFGGSASFSWSGPGLVGNVS